jgi:hypothetical protein
VGGGVADGVGAQGRADEIALSRYAGWQATNEHTEAGPGARHWAVEASVGS